MTVILQLVLLSIAGGAIGFGVFCGSLLPEGDPVSDVVVEPELMQERESWVEGEHKDVLPEANVELAARRAERERDRLRRLRFLAQRGGVS